MSCKYKLHPWVVIISAIIFISAQSATSLKVGLNCSAGGDDCDERVPCPPGSVLDKISGKCVCNPDHCMPSPQCRYTSKFIIKHNATKLPGDCCDIYECVMPTESNCTGIVCPDNNVTCPSDSLSLPRRLTEGECCSVPGGCECLPASCPIPECQEGFREQIIKPGTNIPGSCCPVYECQPYRAKRATCKHEGRELVDGEILKKDKCEECKCTKGEIRCTKTVECPPLPDRCHKSYQEEGDCCPQCQSIIATVTEPVPPGGCKSGLGSIFPNEVSWYKDECTKCTCIKGKEECQAAFCIPKSCPNATWQEGECCPRCNGISVADSPDCPPRFNCSLSCSNGFARDESNCFMCKCREEYCKIHCPHGYLKDEQGVELCECAIGVTSHCSMLTNCHKKCRNGYKLNKFGCPICKCDHHCKPVEHNCKKNCPHGLQTDHRGCLICKCRGSPYLSENITTGLKEHQCITEMDVLRDDGEAWNDGCRQCYCHRGREMCALIACPKLDCPDPVITKTSCCPTCPGNDTRLATQVVCYGPDGLLKLEGESWSIGCVDCICHGGRVMCNREICPPAPCSHPLPPALGECCPRCTTEMQPAVTSLQGCGVDRPARSTWREGNCVSCFCANGIASCFTESCHQIDITCKSPLQVKNMCCPICLDGGTHDDTTCHVGNVTFNLGDEWEQDKCKRCTCEQGRTVSCIQTICDSPCSTNNENPCCPKCKDFDGSSTSIFTNSVFICALCVVMIFFGAAIPPLIRLCCLRRHQLKICQSDKPYRYVQTLDSSTTQSTPLTRKSPV